MYFRNNDSFKHGYIHQGTEDSVENNETKKRNDSRLKWPGGGDANEGDPGVEYSPNTQFNTIVFEKLK